MHMSVLVMYSVCISLLVLGDNIQDKVLPAVSPLRFSIQSNSSNTLSLFTKWVVYYIVPRYSSLQNSNSRKPQLIYRISFLPQPLGSNIVNLLSAGLLQDFCNLLCIHCKTKYKFSSVVHCSRFVLHMSLRPRDQHNLETQRPKVVVPKLNKNAIFKGPMVSISCRSRQSKHLTYLVYATNTATTMQLYCTYFTSCLCTMQLMKGKEVTSLILMQVSSILKMVICFTTFYL